MSGGHWQYSGSRLRDLLEQIAGDREVRWRWPRIAQFLASLAPILYDAEHEMDWDLSSDSSVKDDRAFEDRICHVILVAAMQAADDRLFPRGKWATIQAVQGRMIHPTTEEGAR